MPVRASILRSYYEALFRGDDSHRFAGATFDEYFALLRRRYRGVSPSWAAGMAPSHGRPDLAKRLADFAPDPPFVDTRSLRALAERYPTLSIEEGAVDLSRSLKGRRIRVVDLAQSEVSSWRALAGRDLVDARFRRCATDELAEIEPPARTEALDLDRSDDGCATVLGSGLRARSLSMLHRTPVSLGLFARQRSLEQLVVSAPLVFGARHLTARSLKKLTLSRAELSDELRALLVANASTLEELSLCSARPFGPEHLPTLPRLRLLSVPAYASYRAEWLGFATRFEQGHVQFQHPGDERDAPVCSHLEAVGEADLLCIEDRKPMRRRFELWTVLAPPLAPGLRERLAARGRVLQLPIRWSLAGGVVIASARAPEPCHAAARVVKEVASGAAPPPAPARPHPEERTAGSAGEQWLESWEDGIPPALVAKARAVLAGLEQELRSSGPRAGRATGRSILKRAVEKLNRLHQQHGHFIGSLEAEELHDALRSLSAGRKLADVDALVEEWRVW